MHINAYDWRLVSPFSVELEHQVYRLAFEVEHSLRQGEDPTDDDLPRVVRIDRLERIDREPLGIVKLDLSHIAIVAVARAINQGFFMVRVVGTKMWGNPEPDNWRQVAQVIRATFIHTGPRFTWSDDLDALLIEIVRHVADHGSANMEEIAAEFGTTPARLRTRLSELRKRHDNIPHLKTGRPPKANSPG